MFATPTDAIAYGLRASQRLLHRYLDDLKPGEWDHQPCPGANSAGWVVGHLALIDRRILMRLGATDLPAVPDGFDAKFAATKMRAESQAGAGDPAALLALFDAHRDRLIAAVAAATPEQLADAIPSASGLFADVGEAALFLAVHSGLHLGQVTVVRRSLGYPPGF